MKHKPLTALTTPDEYARINQLCAECIQRQMTPWQLIDFLFGMSRLSGEGDETAYDYIFRLIREDERRKR
jgi:hypothetical protein